MNLKKSFIAPLFLSSALVACSDPIQETNISKNHTALENQEDFQQQAVPMDQQPIASQPTQLPVYSVPYSKDQVEASSSNIFLPFDKTCFFYLTADTLLGHNSTVPLEEYETATSFYMRSLAMDFNSDAMPLIFEDERRNYVHQFPYLASDPQGLRNSIAQAATSCVDIAINERMPY